MPSVHDRVLGCLIGGALGDAMGQGCEGLGPDPHRELPQSGQLTDDTQLTLATCEAVLESGAIDVAAIARSLVTWHRQGRLRGLGSSTLKALRDLDAGAHWALAGAKGEFAAGAGAAMRVAPLAFLLDLSQPSSRGALRDVAQITHRNDEAYIGALAMALAVQSLNRAPRTPEQLWQVADELPDSRVRDRLDELAAVALAHPADVAQLATRSGHVAEVVPFAIAVAATTADMGLAPALQVVVRAGGDTDTIGSLVGSLVGTRHGVHATQGMKDRVPELEGHLPTMRAYASLVASSV